MSPTPSFACFPLLPLELRLKIWHHADDTHRREIFIHTSDDCETFTYSPAPIPLLSVNHESRVETLNSYTLLSSPHLHAPCYINPSRDVVDISDIRVKKQWPVHMMRILEEYGVERRFVRFDEDGERWDWNENSVNTDKWDRIGELRNGGRNRSERPPDIKRRVDMLFFIYPHCARLVRSL